MALTTVQFLQNLLSSITDYYTATYSSDTDLYEILRMYGGELSSGSIALDTVRDNTFVVKCEESQLFPNFGTFFGVAKFKDQQAFEDRYISSSGSATNTAPTIYEDVVEGSVTWRYVYPGTIATTPYVQPISIPGYRKQLDFFMEGAMKGGTVEGIKRAIQGFSLISADVREISRISGWKLKTFSGSVSQVSENIWQFDAYVRPRIWGGCHVTFHSGSAVTDKFTAGYLINTSSGSNRIIIAPIYNPNLLWDLRRLEV